MITASLKIMLVETIRDPAHPDTPFVEQLTPFIREGQVSDECTCIYKGLLNPQHPYKSIFMPL